MDHTFCAYPCIWYICLCGKALIIRSALCTVWSYWPREEHVEDAFVYALLYPDPMQMSIPWHNHTRTSKMFRDVMMSFRSSGSHLLFPQLLPSPLLFPLLLHLSHSWASPFASRTFHRTHQSFWTAPQPPTHSAGPNLRRLLLSAEYPRFHFRFWTQHRQAGTGYDRSTGSGQHRERGEVGKVERDRGRLRA